MHSHTNFDRAVTLTRAVDAALLGDDTSDQKGVFDAIYATLETMEAHEAGEHEQLDEEEELELTEAGEAVIDSYEMEDEFSEFSPSVGTFEGTQALEHIYGRTAMGRAPVGERVYSTPASFDLAMRSIVHKTELPIPPTLVPAWPVVYPDSAKTFSSSATIGRAFEPCGAD